LSDRIQRAALHDLEDVDDMAKTQRSLVLILARELADQLASAAFIVDEAGTLVYFNERCAEILGMPFAEAGAMPMERWSQVFAPSDLEGRTLSRDELPLVRALTLRSPEHRTLRIQSQEGQARDIAITALPLFAHEDDCVGAIALFWEHAESDGKP
jgi:PAS domain-containing protein